MLQTYHSEPETGWMVASIVQMKPNSLQKNTLKDKARSIHQGQQMPEVDGVREFGY